MIKFVKSLNISLNKEKFNGEFVISDGFILARPLTYMNKSGDFIYSIANFYKIDSSDIIVIYDDLSFFSWTSKAIKIGGSSAGHKGIESLNEQI